MSFQIAWDSVSIGFELPLELIFTFLAVRNGRAPSKEGI